MQLMQSLMLKIYVPSSNPSIRQLPSGNNPSIRSHRLKLFILHSQIGPEPQTKKIYSSFANWVREIPKTLSALKVTLPNRESDPSGGGVEPQHQISTKQCLGDPQGVFATRGRDSGCFFLAGGRRRGRIADHFPYPVTRLRGGDMSGL